VRRAENGASRLVETLEVVIYMCEYRDIDG